MFGILAFALDKCSDYFLASGVIKSIKCMFVAFWLNVVNRGGKLENGMEMF